MPNSTVSRVQAACTVKVCTDPLLQNRQMRIDCHAVTLIYAAPNRLEFKRNKNSVIKHPNDSNNTYQNWVEPVSSLFHFNIMSSTTFLKKVFYISSDTFSKVKNYFCWNMVEHTFSPKHTVHFNSRSSVDSTLWTTNRRSMQSRNLPELCLMTLYGFNGNVEGDQ